jgi:hypothetical protein
MDFQTGYAQETQVPQAPLPPPQPHHVHQQLPPEEGRKKRSLSEKQLDALRVGRERRWKKMGLESVEAPLQRGDMLSEEPRYYDREREYREQDKYYSEASSDSSEDESDRKQRKFFELQKSIPKSLRKRVDRYIRKRMEIIKAAEEKNKADPYKDPYDPYYNLPPPFPTFQHQSLQPQPQQQHQEEAGPYFA